MDSKKKFPGFICSILLLLMCRPERSVNQRNCIPCDIQQIVLTEDLIHHIQRKEFEIFLCTIKNECKNNVEFNEYCNDVLFKLIDQHPDMFVDILSKDESYDIEYIMLQIAQPLKDYNIDDFIYKIKKSFGKKDIKNKIIVALEKAKAKNY